MRQVHGACWSSVNPTPVDQPSVVAYSAEMAKRLGLSKNDCQSPQFAEVFAGNSMLDGMVPFATCYGGHQFGGWAGQLGDGRAISLGEVVNADGERWELQLKGAGPTPYSRHADGRAVLRSSIREFLCSEAMHHLGVPTTRALSLVLTGERVLRDMFYDGRAEYEPGAIVCRVAPTFIRFGHFELPASRGDLALLEQLVMFTVSRDFPHLGEPTRTLIPQWLMEIAENTAKMIVDWMRVGFVHGVMNTDNMSIASMTIDYGPYGWLEGFDPQWTPNTTDAAGRRYAYGAQPQIGLWNVGRLMGAVSGLIDDRDSLQIIVDKYITTFQTEHNNMWANKLGLRQWNAEDQEHLIDPLMKILQMTETDMTIFYRRLAQVPCDQNATPSELLSPLAGAYYTAQKQEHEVVTLKWLRRYTARVRTDDRDKSQRHAQMNSANPKYVLRNYLAQNAIAAAESGDTTEIDTLLALLAHPYDEQPKHEDYAAKRPEWARDKPGCSTLSCSS